jgi:hypothetical protein
MSELFDRCPRLLRAHNQHGAPRYRLVGGRFAVHGPAATAGPLTVLARLEGDDIVVASGEPPAWAASNDRLTIGPVYMIEPAGQDAVPTGRVLVRFSDGVVATDRSDALYRAGFKIAHELSYAPQAAFVTAIDHDICSALLGIPALEALSGAVHVEPEMLSQVARRLRGLTGV